MSATRPDGWSPAEPLRTPDATDGPRAPVPARRPATSSPQRGNPPLARTFAAVTTCSSEGYQAYGRRMIRTFDRHWPAEIHLHVYGEGFVVEAPSGRIVPHDLMAEAPDLVAFKQRHVENPLAHGRSSRKKRKLLFDRKWLRPRIKTVNHGLGYLWDAVRFSHKLFSVFAAVEAIPADVLFWVDADMLFFRDVPVAFLEGLIPRECLVAFLHRKRRSECGFVAYNLRHPEITRFLADLKCLYTEDALFREKEFNDCYLFDRVRRRFERRGCQTYDIGEGIGKSADHVLINSRLGDYMDHLKGNRKATGRSRQEDLVVAKEVDYWRAPAPS